MAVDFSQEIKDLRTTMASVREVTDLTKLEATIADFEKQASDPNLWDDQEKAQVVTSGLSRAKAEHDRVTGMDARIDDLEALVEMGQEENDAETLLEAERELVVVRKAVGALEVHGEFLHRRLVERGLLAGQGAVRLDLRLVWQVGNHILACGDLELDEGRKLLEYVGENPDLTYCDPPWTPALATGFRTKAGVPQKVQFNALLNRIVDACHYAKGAVFIEMGKQHIDDLKAICEAHGALVMEVWDTTYDGKVPSKLLRAGFSDAARRQPAKTPYAAIYDFTEPGALIWDPCLGRGLTATSAASAGRRAIGLELSPRRLAVAISKLAGPEQPARRIYNLRGDTDASD